MACGDVAVLAGPADAPFVHLADALGAFLAQQARQPLVAQPAAGLERVVVDDGSSGPASPRRARPRPSSAPSRWRRRGRSGCGRRGTPRRRARAASIAAYMPAPPDPMIRTSVSTCMGSAVIESSYQTTAPRACVPGAAQHARSAMMRCRPGIVTDTAVVTVPDLRCTARRTRVRADGKSFALHRVRDTHLRGQAISLRLRAAIFTAWMISG